MSPLPDRLRAAAEPLHTGKGSSTVGQHLFRVWTSGNTGTNPDDQRAETVRELLLEAAATVERLTEAVASIETRIQKERIHAVIQYAYEMNPTHEKTAFSMVRMAAED